MKKILILGNSSSGLYGFRNDLVKSLLTEYEVVISVPDEVNVKELTEEGARVIHTDINRRGVNPKEDLSLYRNYRTLLKEERPDLVLTYTIKPNIYGGFACRISKIPYICTITGLGSTFQKEGLLKKMIVMMYRTALKKAECVFFQNSENKRIFDECGIKGKTSTVVNGSGVDLSEHEVLPYPSEEKGAQILYVGRNMKEKGTDELLLAAKHFGNDTSVTFKLLGYNDEDYEEKIKEAEEKGYIITHGYDTDVNKHLKECSAVVLPTYHEGMSNVLQEAAAVGRPVIATNIPGCREIFEDGVTGFGCEPKSAESLINAIDRFLKLTNDERKEMGLKGRAKVEKEFDRKNITKAYLSTVHSILLE